LTLGKQTYKKYGSITQKKVIHRKALYDLNFGVMEYWSIGVLAESLEFSFNTPLLQHSNTPTS